MSDDLHAFYRHVRATRRGVLDWFETLPSEVLHQEHPEFVGGGLLGIQTHVVYTYLGWVEHVGLGRERRRPAIADLSDLRRAFGDVDAVVAEAIDAMGAPFERFEFTWPDGQVEPLVRGWTVLHPITHEFHHKGQSLALARALGHPHPGDPDTDLVARPEEFEDPT
jgi:uncharacterized damage-inducible protein DinB